MKYLQISLLDVHMYAMYVFYSMNMSMGLGTVIRHNVKRVGSRYYVFSRAGYNGTVHYNLQCNGKGFSLCWVGLLCNKKFLWPTAHYRARVIDIIFFMYPQS
jgi:hypothetical protein